MFNKWASEEREQIASEALKFFTQCTYGFGGEERRGQEPDNLLLF